jgi:hypothetical protein
VVLVQPEALQALSPLLDHLQHLAPSHLLAVVKVVELLVPFNPEVMVALVAVVVEERPARAGQEILHQLALVREIMVAHL